jgi:hypothetical protein
MGAVTIFIYDYKLKGALIEKLKFAKCPDISTFQQ